MKLRLSVKLDFLDYEQAVKTAEAGIAAGGDILEIGRALLKNCGMQCIRDFRQRFPDMYILVDFQATAAESEGILACVQAGANAVTVSGIIDAESLQKYAYAAQKCGLDLFLDFRSLAPMFIRQQLPLVSHADYILLQFTPESEILLQEMAFHHAGKIILCDPQPDDLMPLLSLGMAGIGCCDDGVQGITDKVRFFREFADKTSELPSIDSAKYSRQLLRDKVARLQPNWICEVLSEQTVFLENLYPLHRYTQVAGQAFTIRVPAGAQRAVAESLLEAPADSIVLVDATGERNAVWNYLCTMIAIKQKLAGVVVYGAITEINLIHGKGFPCYITSLTTLPANRETTSSLQTNVPIRIGHATVYPEDWLVGDDSGIICVPAAKIFHAVEKAEQIEEKRRGILQKLEKNQKKETLRSLIAEYYNVS